MWAGRCFLFVRQTGLVLDNQHWIFKAGRWSCVPVCVRASRCERRAGRERTGRRVTPSYNVTATANTLTTQYMVRFSHLTVQLPVEQKPQVNQSEQRSHPNWESLLQHYTHTHTHCNSTHTHSCKLYLENNESHLWNCDITKSFVGTLKWETGEKSWG